METKKDTEEAEAVEEAGEEAEVVEEAVVEEEAVVVDADMDMEIVEEDTRKTPRTTVMKIVETLIEEEVEAGEEVVAEEEVVVADVDVDEDVEDTDEGTLMNPWTTVIVRVRDTEMIEEAVVVDEAVVEEEAGDEVEVVAGEEDIIDPDRDPSLETEINSVFI